VNALRLEVLNAEMLSSLAVGSQVLIALRPNGQQLTTDQVSALVWGLGFHLSSHQLVPVTAPAVAVPLCWFLLAACEESPSRSLARMCLSLNIPPEHARASG
jgi:hypothetical protein